jgi:hypothetical protein
MGKNGHLLRIPTQRVNLRSPPPPVLIGKMLISPAGRRRREITDKNKQTRHLFARSEKEQQRPLKRKCKTNTSI